MNIYVGNLNYKVGEEDLSNLFSDFGEVVSVKIIKDAETGKAKGFAFIEMADADAASNAISELDGKELMGRNLKVNKAKRKRTNEGGNQRNFKPNFNKKRTDDQS